MTVDEWEALPWWQQWMYMEELEGHLRQQAGANGAGGRGGGQEGGSPRDVPISGDLFDDPNFNIKRE